jgi:hypothetical protein
MYGNFFPSAAASNDVETIKAWITAGVNINICDYDQRTALHVVGDLLFSNHGSFLVGMEVVACNWNFPCQYFFHVLPLFMHFRQ